MRYQLTGYQIGDKTTVDQRPGAGPKTTDAPHGYVQGAVDPLGA